MCYDLLVTPVNYQPSRQIKHLDQKRTPATPGRSVSKDNTSRK